MFTFFKLHPEYQFYIALGGALITLLGFILFKKIVNKFLLKLASKISFRGSTVVEEFNTSIKQPLEYWWLATGLYISLEISPFVASGKSAKPPLILGEEVQLTLDIISSELLTNTYAACVIVILAWAGCNLVAFYEKFLVNIGSKFTLFDNSVLIRFSSKLIKLTLIIIAILASVSQFIRLTPILTGVGFAGAALTFIAKDTLTDVLSGIILMIDKPFSIGDWIQIDTLEGTVEDVSFRSTRIRTFTQGLVVVPNSTLSDNNITNWSAMAKRRVTFDLGLTYSTSKEDIQLAVSEIEQLLRNHPHVESGSALVYFSTFGNSSLDITIIYYSTLTDLIGFSKLKEDINLRIMDIVAEHKLNIAFPTQTIILDK